ncbi:STY4528 family pathogenicity island replication protein, partial [Halomonas sp. BBD48]|nr:STY4528 family pathogenicity island replication protein [Halomonas sp. BBD48]
MKNYDVLIGRAASFLTQRRGSEASALADEEDALDGLLFLGNPHETVPRALLVDHRLGAVDVLGWQVIRLMSNADRSTAFPTYDELEPLLRSGAGQKASRKTVARVIAILRLTRWMTLGMKARNTANGRMIGNIYVLHDEPLAPA